MCVCECLKVCMNVYEYMRVYCLLMRVCEDRHNSAVKMGCVREKTLVGIQNEKFRKHTYVS